MGQLTAQKCKVALDKIIESSRLVTSMISEINYASKEQAMGIIEINKEISRLDKVTQQNLTTAQKSSTQAENLNTEANSLSHSVKKLVEFSNGSK